MFQECAPSPPCPATVPSPPADAAGSWRHRHRNCLATKSWAICSQRRTSPLNRTSVVGAVLAGKLGVAHRLLALGPVSHFNRGVDESLLHFGELSAGSRRSLAARARALSRPARNRDPALRRPAWFVMGVLGIFAGGPRTRTDALKLARTAVAASITAPPGDFHLPAVANRRLE
jgi:hypothetical protein